MRIQNVSADIREQVHEFMTKNGRALHLTQQNELRNLQRAHAQQRSDAGFKAYRPAPKTFSEALRIHLDGCESGAYPTAIKTAEAVGRENAKKLLGKQNPKRVRQALKDNRNHPGMRRILMVTGRSSTAAMVAGKLSSFLGAIAAAHKLACHIESLENNQQQARAERTLDREELQRLRERVLALETRHALEDDGKHWRAVARQIIEAEPEISKRELARRVGVAEGTVRKYWHVL